MQPLTLFESLLILKTIVFTTELEQTAKTTYTMKIEKIICKMYERLV